MILFEISHCERDVQGGRRGWRMPRERVGATWPVHVNDGESGQRLSKDTAVLYLESSDVPFFAEEHSQHQHATSDARMLS